MGLPHRIIEHILERLDVKSLLKFKLVSKQWYATIQSRQFQKRHLTHRRQSGNPDVLMVSLYDESYNIEAMRSLVLTSSISVKIPTLWENAFFKVGNNSCDGLVCLSDELLQNHNIVFNPSTRWHRVFPRSTYQLLKRRDELELPQTANLGFGKDKIDGTYKAVLVYNSSELYLNNNYATVCELFDFTTHSWRYVVPSSPYPILDCQDPVYFDGSLHWLATKDKTMVLSLDLHTETFQVFEVPFVHHQDVYGVVGMCNLNDRLCVYEEKWREQVIWSFDSDHKIWKQIYSIDLTTITSPLKNRFTPKPLAIVDKEKLLVRDSSFGVELLIYDPKTKGCEVAYSSENYVTAHHLCYFPSLISIV